MEFIGAKPININHLIFWTFEKEYLKEDKKNFKNEISAKNFIQNL
jgi:hypothetical protein